MQDSDPSGETSLLDALAEEFLARYRVGERPSISEFVARESNLADSIRVLFPTLGVVESVGRVVRAKSRPRGAGAGKLTENQKSRIDEAMDRAPSHGWNITHGCYFFLAGEVLPTLFRKQTKYPLWNDRLDPGTRM